MSPLPSRPRRGASVVVRFSSAPRWISLAVSRVSPVDGPRLSGLVIVLTLAVNEQEGHLPYLSQSGTPAKEPLWEDGPMTLDESVHGMRLRVIERAQVLGNVSAVCRELGISRTLFYRWRTRLERYGVDGVHPRRQRGRAGRPVATPPEVERLVLGIAISAATWGCRRIAAYLAQTWQVRVAPSTVQRLLRRVGLATRRARLTVLEQQAARTAGLLTDRTRQTLWRARHGRTRHVEANEPGQLVCLDTFYIGNLKGVGKVWQITACDAATSYGLAGLLPAHDAAAAATFLREVRRAPLPARRLAGAARAHRWRPGVQGRV